MVASLVQRQRRGVDHFHIPLRAAPWDHETNRLYIASLKELGSSYDFGYVDDGYLPRHPKLPNGRPNRSLPKRNLVFEDPIVAGRYLCRYLTDSAQLIELLTSRERVSRPLWVNPELTRASGVICRRLRRVRLAFHVVRALDAGSRPRLPAWWGDLGERRKTLALLRMPTALGP
jgi:hypothetical protein